MDADTVDLVVDLARQLGPDTWHDCGNGAFVITATTGRNVELILDVSDADVDVLEAALSLSETGTAAVLVRAALDQAWQEYRWRRRSALDALARERADTITWAEMAVEHDRIDRVSRRRAA